MIYLFEDCELDTALRELRRSGDVRAIEPQVFDLLLYLVENRDRMVSKDELNERIWRGRAVSEASLSTCIKLARQAVGDSGKTQEFIRTVPRRGFRFVASVESRDSVSVGAAVTAADVNGDVALDLDHFDRPSIVIMPFKDLGGGDRHVLAEGIRLSLHSMLVKLSGLFLLHTGTVERYRGQEVSALDVGKDLDVRYVAEGAVQHWGNRVRVSVQLTDVADGRLIWGERYDRVLDNLFDLEDEIAREVIGALDIKLRTGEAGRLFRQGVADPLERERFHQGLSHLYKGTKDDNAAARRIYEKLEESRPDWPAILGLIAFTHWRDAQFGWSADRANSFKEAAAIAQRAVDLGDPDGIAFAVIGHYLLYQRRHDEALSASGEAMVRRPSCPLSNAQLAEVMQYCGEPERAVLQIKQAMRLVRVFPSWMIKILAACYRDNNDMDASIAAAKEAVRRFPDELDGWIILCCAYQLCGSRTEAEKMARQITQIDPSFTISHYAASQPYQDRTNLDRILEGLRKSGLPE